MIRIYLDWNVLNQMKNGIHSDLYRILKDNDKFLLFYSTAHIGDIFSSYLENENQKRIIESDLQFISDFTHNNCILCGKDNQPYIDSRSPHQLFSDRIESEKITKNFSIDSLQKTFSDIGLDALGKQYVGLLKSIPFDPNLTQALNDPKTSKYLNEIFPGLRENLTMEGFFNSFMKMVDGMNNNLSYDDLRKGFQNGLNINRDKIFDSKNPFTDIEKHLKPITDNGVDGLIKKLYSYQNKMETTWFDDFINIYINLDISGFQEDKVEIQKGKKQTFKNTTEDAFHSAFASICDIYILNDKKGFRKTIEVYNHQRINTKVFKPSEFVEYHDKCLDINNGFQYLDLIAYHLKEIEPQVVPNENGHGYFRTYFSSFFIFNYFNKIYVVDIENEKVPMIFLSKDKPTNGKFTFFKEIETLIKDLNNYFGQDCNSLGLLNLEEFENLDKWQGRQWELENLSLRLVQINGYFQLYLDIKTK